MRSIAFVSEKGGVAKTTTTLNVAAGLAARGRRVLVVDTDPQGNASHVLLRGAPARRPTLFEVLTGDADAGAAIVATGLEGVEVLPADATLADATVVLAGEIGRERRLRAALEGVGDRYDFVLVDTAPTRSILTTNVLNYCRELIVPFTPGLFGVLGLGQLQQDVGQVRRLLENKALRIVGILLTQTDKNNVHRQLEDELRGLYGPLVFKAKIPRSIKVEEAHSRHETVLSYAPASGGATAYMALTEEILDGSGQGQEGRDQDAAGDPHAHHAA
jgi:chromosome partitioning protein